MSKGNASRGAVKRGKAPGAARDDRRRVAGRRQRLGIDEPKLQRALAPYVAKGLIEALPAGAGYRITASGRAFIAKANAIGAPKGSA